MRRLPLDSLLSVSSMLRLILVTGIGLALDLWTKTLARTHLESTQREIEFIPGWLHFKYVGNPGAVFGLGAGQRTFFVLVSVAAVAFLFYLFIASHRRQWFYQIIIAMLMAGVLGNLYDRVTYGYVRDMINIFPAWPKLFPWVFNIADSLLCIGVPLMFLYTYLHSPDKTPKTTTSPSADR
jgi:signal peptidase II